MGKGNLGLINYEAPAADPSVTTDGETITGDGTPGDPIKFNSASLTGKGNRPVKVNDLGNGFDFGLGDYGAILFVATTGNDATGKRGHLGLPYATIEAAVAASQPVDLIYIYNGLYMPAAPISLTHELAFRAQERAVIFTNSIPSSQALFKLDYNAGSFVWQGGAWMGTSGTFLEIATGTGDHFIDIDMVNFNQNTNGKRLLSAGDSSNNTIRLSFQYGDLSSGNLVTFTGDNNTISVHFDYIDNLSTDSSGSGYSLIELGAASAADTTRLDVNGSYYFGRQSIVYWSAHAAAASPLRTLSIQIDRIDHNNLGFFLTNYFEAVRGRISGTYYYSEEEYATFEATQYSEIELNIEFEQNDAANLFDASVYVNNNATWIINANMTKTDGGGYTIIDVASTGRIIHRSGQLRHEVNAAACTAIEVQGGADYDFYSGSIYLANAALNAVQAYGAGASDVRLYNNLFTNALRDAALTYVLTGTDIIPGENVI